MQLSYGLRVGLTSSNVVPVRVVRSQLLERTGLDSVDPVGNLQLSGSLQVRRVGSDESIGTEIYETGEKDVSR
jgi:hypothetical protein